MEGRGLLPPQTIWSTRVPCPGGRGAGTVAREACTSLALLSGALGAVVTGGFTAGVFTGVDAAMLEILIQMILTLRCYGLWQSQRQRFMNPNRKPRRIAVNPARW